MGSVPAKVSYMVSKQGNRNLVLDEGVQVVKFDILSQAVEAAERATRTTGQGHWVHEVSIKTVRSYRPGPAVGTEY